MTWLRDQRAERSLTQAQAAGQVGVSQGVWSRWESGKVPVPDGMPGALAEAWGLDVDDVREALHVAGPAGAAKGAQGAVRKLASGRYQARYRDPEGRERSVTRDTRAEAKLVRAQVQTQLAAGDWIDPVYGDVKYSSWLEAWRRTRVHGLDVTTNAVEASHVKNHVLPRWGEQSLRSISTMAVKAWVAELSATLAAATVSKIYRIFAGSIEAALEEGLLRKTPCTRSVVMPKPDQDEAVFLTADQVAGLVEQMRPEWARLTVVAFNTGLRWSEMAGLKVGRVEMLRRRLQVVEVVKEPDGAPMSFGPPKSRASRRTVTLPQVALDAIAEQLAAVPARAPHQLLWSTRTGGPHSRANWARTFSRALERAQAADRVPGDLHPTGHSLRHSHAAALISAGVNAKALQVRLGHGSISVTMDRYGHLFPGDDEQLLAALDAAAAGYAPRLTIAR